MEPFYQYLIVVALAGAFGGFVHGILRRRPTEYPIAWPFFRADRNRDGGRNQLGILGDIFVGIAAGTTIFVVMDTAFGLKADEIGNVGHLQEYLKFVALGVIFGYMGPSLLESIALTISKRIVKAERKLEEDVEELEKLRNRSKAADRAIQVIELADAYRRWKRWGLALQAYDQAIAIEPENPHHYLQKSLVYADQGDEEHSKKQKADLYDAAMEWVERALLVDKKYGRAYYDRACYRRLKNSSEEEVLDDLRKAFQLNDNMKNLAKFDPDLRSLQEKEAFKELVDAVPVGGNKAGEVPHHGKRQHGRRRG
jgi:hypothetical protein